MKTPHIQPPLWNVQYQQNPFFTGREDILQQLHQALHTESAVALSHPQSISGLGGIGKTQTALEYVYRYGMNYNAVFWVQADSAVAIISGYVALAHLLRLPERDEQNQRIIIDAVLRWLRLNTGWLLVFDNMDDLAIAEHFLPKAGQGHILFTTRAHASQSFAARLEIQKMDPETGALLLLRRADILPPRSLLESASHENRSIASEISQELDGLPLALDQAGAYIKETPCSPVDYLARYQTRHQDLLQARGSENLSYPASVATTWSLAFEKVSQANPAAAELLNFCAYLAPDAIPEELLTSGASGPNPVLAPVATQPIKLDLACKEVLRFSLLQRGADAQTLTIHRLVQTVLRDSMPRESQQQWMQYAIEMANAAFPDIEFANWPLCERLMPHALVCAIWIEQLPDILSAAFSRLLHQAGEYFHYRARYAEAEPLYQRALAIREQQFGADHPDTAQSLNNLALLFKTQGQYSLAEPLYIRALAIREQQFGTDHPDTAQSLNNLALLYREQGKYEQAEQLLQRALTIDEQVLGPEHQHVVIDLNNLTELYRVQGKYEQAKPLLQRALAICEQQLGAQHPYTAQGLNNLAGLYQVQSQYSSAEPLYIRALAIREQLGPLHPDLAISLNDLALLYYKQGRYTDAEPVNQRALQIFEQALGSEHPWTRKARGNYARLLRATGRATEAAKLEAEDNG